MKLLRVFVRSSFFFILFALHSCEYDKITSGLDELCTTTEKPTPPPGYTLTRLGSMLFFNGYIEYFQFPDDKVGYAFGISQTFDRNVQCLKTIDGGHEWTKLSINIPLTPSFMIFKDSNHGIITLQGSLACGGNCDDKCSLIKTSDGGLNWEYYEVPNLQGSIIKLQSDSTGNLFGLIHHGFTSTLVRSSDFGDTWDTVHISDMSDIDNWILEIHDEKIYVTDDDNNIHILDTNGLVLKVINTLPVHILHLEVIDDKHFIATGYNQIIRTEDGGETWETIYNRKARMIGFTDPDRGLMILNKLNCPSEYAGDLDVIASTDDGGITWTESALTSNLAQHLINSQRIENDRYLLIIDLILYELKKN